MIKQIIKKIIPSKFLEQPGYFKKFDKKEIKALENKFKGQRCFILGNGPSLNLVDLSLLKEEFSFAVNGIFYKTQENGYKPNFYTVEDSLVVEDNLVEINKYECEYKFFPSNYKGKIIKDKNTYFFNIDEGFYHENSKFFEIPRFSKDCSNVIYCGQSVTFINLQLAYYLGFTEVYLIGMDFDYVIPNSIKKVKGAVLESTEEDVNHFHPEYFGKGKKWHDPKLHNVLKSYIYHKEIYEKDNRKIFNATVGGALEVFERVNYIDLFKEKN